MDGAWFLVVAPRLLVGCFFCLIVATVVFSVMSAEALDARVLCQLTLVVVGAIAIALDVRVLLIAIVPRMVLCVA